MKLVPLILLPILISAILTGILMVIGWRRRSNPAAFWFTVLAATACGWSSLELISYLSDGTAKHVLTHVRYGPISLLPVAWVLFSAGYTNLGSRIKKRHVVALLALPIVTMVLVATNDMHGLVFARQWFIDRGAFITTGHLYGPWFWIHTSYSYLLLVGGVLFAASRLRHAARTFRGQAIVMLAGAMSPAIANLLYLSNDAAFGFLDPTPVAFGVSTIFFAIGLFRYDLLDILPVARNHVFDVIDEAVVVFDYSGRILDMNSAAAETIGDGNRLGHVATTGLLAEAWELREIDEVGEKEIFGEDGVHWISWTMSPLATGRAVGKGLGKGWLFHGRDFTEAKLRETALRAAKEKAEELSRLKSTFLSNMNHEFRTPLAGIIGLADVLDEELTGEQGQFVQLMRKGAERLLATLDSVLAVADLDSGNVRLFMKPVDVGLVATELVAEFRPTAREKHLSITVAAPAHPVWVHLDPSRFRQGMRQLVGNAIKYTDRGRIRVGVELTGDHVEVYVRDTGRGISPEFLPRLFEGFCQESQGHNREFEGTGLGLRIASGLIEQMGGRIDVESKVGEGSCFSVRFDRHKAGGAGKTAPRHPIRRGVSPVRASRGPA